MRALLLAAVPILSLAAATPAFPQGVQMPNAANATPPPGTVPPPAARKPAKRAAPVRRHPRRAHRPAASVLEQRAPAAYGVGEARANRTGPG